MEDPIEARLKESFSKVKEDISFLKKDIEKIKKAILEEDKDRLSLKEEIKELKGLLSKKKVDKPDFFLNSSGNKGVFRQTFDRLSTDTGQTFDKRPLEEIFLTLTNREFMVFTALYHLEEELKSPITYRDLSNKLKMSQSSIRDHISELIRKNTPVKKVKINNKFVILTIEKSFRDLNILGKILTFRNFQGTQTTLSDI